MADTAAQQIRDDLIEQEVLYRRTDAGVRLEVDRRLAQLERDLKKLVLSVDVNSAMRKGTRQRRLKNINDESKILIRTAYSEVNGILRGAMRRIAKVETKKTTDIIRKRVP